MRTQPTGRASEVVEGGQPAHCGNGHPLGPRQVIVGHAPCLCCWPERGHRCYSCRTCGSTAYLPAHDSASNANQS